MTNEIKEIKIGMYTTDEILKFMTNGEGRSFMGRSMYDAIIDYITNLQEDFKEADEAVKYWQEQYDNLQQRIDKAVEYINKEVGDEIHDMMYIIDVSDLLDILRGDE